MRIDGPEIALNTLAGLGFLFVGIKMLSRSLSAAAGDRLRRAIATASSNTALSAVFGALAGFVTQSGRTTAFILASFVQAGLLETRRALPAVLWSNFGCTLVVFAAVFPIKLVTLLLLALAGTCVAFERPKSMLNLASAVFGLALMLFGLKMMSSSASDLTNFGWFASVLAFINTSLVFAFLTGLVLTVVAQSHLAIMLIAAALAGKGVFTLDQTLMAMFGAHAGASVITFVTGIHYRGQPRQVVTGQVLYNLVAVALFLALFEGLRLAGSVQFAFAAAGLAFPPGITAAIVAAIVNTLTPLALTLALPAFQRLCARLAPPLPEEDLGRPQFLREEVSEDASTTLLLAEQEQLRLLKRLPAYCGWLRGDVPAKDAPSQEAHHSAFAQVGGSIDRFQRALMSRQMTSEDTEWLLNQQRRQQLLIALEETCFDLWATTRGGGAKSRALRGTVIEALDTLLLTAIAAMAENDAEELALLEAMTRNHGSTMEGVRKSYLEASGALGPEERNQILHVTSLFERAAWSLHHFGRLLAESQRLIL